MYLLNELKEGKEKVNALVKRYYMQHICKLCMLLFLRSGCGGPINVNTVTEK